MKCKSLMSEECTLNFVQLLVAIMGLFNECIRSALLIARIGSFVRCFFEYNFSQLTEDITKSCRMSYLVLVVP